MKKIKVLLFLYFLFVIGLFLYSYTQVDLSLTLSRASIFQTIEKTFQYVGYFNRPISTYLFIIIVGLLFIFYGIFIHFSDKFSPMTFWKLILPVSIILALSYNAFSYDFFNYIFYTKIILHYRQNPYLVTALNFPKDPMLSFMHWTHNTYPYGPFWLVLTVPLGFLGFNYFLPTFFIFKAFSLLCFIGTVYFIGKITQKIYPKFSTLSMILYAFNPLVLIESLVSAHNDVAMVFLAVLGVYFLIEKKWFLGVLTIALSALTKEATIFLLIPAILYSLNIVLKKHFISEKLFLLFCAVSMIGGLLFAISKIEIQPWYALWVLPFVILIRPNKYLLWITVGFCLGLLLRYVPFLWQGDWNGMASTVKLYVTIITPVVFLILGSLLQRFYVKKQNI